MELGSGRETPSARYREYAIDGLDKGGPFGEVLASCAQNMKLV
jgi:hypothetical protein